MTIGITGHQDLGDAATINWLKKEIEKELDKFKIDNAFSSLAIGADQLFAGLVLGRNIPLIAVIPCQHYEKTFSAENLNSYQALLTQAFGIILLENEEPTESAFYEAGIKIADQSDIIFAVWNNKPSKGLGGTADIVEYARSQHKQLLHFNPVTETTSYLNLPTTR